MARFLSRTRRRDRDCNPLQHPPGRDPSGPFGDYVALSDEARLIEVHLSQAEADARLAKIRAALQ